MQPADLSQENWEKRHENPSARARAGFPPAGGQQVSAPTLLMGFVGDTALRMFPPTPLSLLPYPEDTSKNGGSWNMWRGPAILAFKKTKDTHH